MATPPTYIGIEIGGTKLQAGFGSAEGEIVSLVSVAADAKGGRQAICSQLVSLVEQLLNESGSSASSISGVGVGFGGPVDVAKGRVLKSHQVAGWDDFPLADWLKDQFGLEVALNNDSDLAGLAESRIGAGRGCSPVVYMNIGSGIGGAVTVGGELLTGQGFGASEIGHLRVRPAATGGEWLTLEALASGWNLARRAQEVSQQCPDSLLAQFSHPVATEHLVESVRQGDAKAVEIWTEAVENLGVAIANVITLLAPQRFVVGGGVALAGDLLFDPLRAEVDRHVFAPFRNTFEIVPAQLQQRVVVHGALLWAGKVLPAQG